MKEATEPLQQMGQQMSPGEFRAAGHRVIEWIADYLAHIRDYPVVSSRTPGDLKRQLPPMGPAQGESIERILDDFASQIIPGITHWNHPRFHAYFAVSSSGVGILAEALIAALNINGMLWRTSPAVTELEQVTLRWLLQWLGLPADWFGIIYDTASVGVLHALACARERAQPQSRRQGSTPGLTVYVSEHAHSSAEKGAIALGLGQENVRKIGVDEQFRMRPDLLRREIEQDLAAGRQPCCIVATTGTTSTTSIDPVPAIAAIAEEYGIWLHVDGAYGGSMALAPEFRGVLEGVERADSLIVNPHKWMFVPIDCSVFYTRHPEVLRRAFSLVPEYLRSWESDETVNFMDYGVPLGRRFRSLKLWFVMRYFGQEGLATAIREHVRLARFLAAQIEADPQFELVAPVPMALVCFRRRGPDAESKALMDRINASGRFFLSHTVLQGRFVLRVAIGNIQTTEADIRALWDELRA